jgi:gliding motility-associated-like protein
MKKIFTFFLFLFFSSYLSFGQIDGDVAAPYNSTQYLIENVLSDGNLTITNVSLTNGPQDNLGYFQDNGGLLGFSSGMVMSTNGALWATRDGAGTPGSFGVTDPDISALQTAVGFGGSQNNTTVVEFDLVANTDYFEFWYIFASVEYTGFTCSSFNDLFGFFISGPDPTNPAVPYAGRNIAVIPTDATQNSFTSTPVMINSVNSGVPSGGNPQPCLNVNPNFVADAIFFEPYPSATEMPFNGFTVPLRAYLDVVCGETYHFKLAICDITDGALNSAVFLQEGSLSSPVTASIQTTPNVTPDTNGYFYEGCGKSLVTFTRPNHPDFAPGTGDLDIPFQLMGDATYGSDYVFVNNAHPDKVVIPNNKLSFDLEIQPLEDGITENIEKMILRVPDIVVGASCDNDGFTDIEIEIADHPEVIIDIDEDQTIHCPGDEVKFSIEISGGIPNPIDPEYDIHWSHIGTATDQIVYPNETTTYVVLVQDICPEFKYYDSITITVPEYDDLVSAELDDIYLCENKVEQRFILQDNVTGGDGDYRYEWKNVTTEEVVSTDKDPYLSAGKYEVRITDGCETDTTARMEIFDYELPMEEIVVSETGKELEFNIKNIQYPISSHTSKMKLEYFWDFGDGTTTKGFGNKVHTYDTYGKYTITLKTRNVIGCEKVFYKSLDLKPYIFAPNVFTPNGDGENEGWRLNTTRKIDEFEVRIFDRWGREVFGSTDIEESWYGQDKNNDLCEGGTYVFKAKVKFTNIGYEEVNGIIQLTK